MANEPMVGSQRPKGTHIMDIIQQRTEANGKPRYIGVNAITDGGGNIFIGMAQTRGVGTAFTRNVLIVKLATNGQVSVVDERAIPEGGMADGVGITQSGSFLHVFPGAHIGDPTARLYHYALDVCVPYPEGAVQVGMEGAHMPEEGEPVVEIDYERIAEEVIQRLKQEMGGELRAVLEAKAMDAIGKAFDAALYESNQRSRYVQDAAAPWFRDRAYEGAQAAEG